jgi:transcription elongation factor GreA
MPQHNRKSGNRLTLSLWPLSGFGAIIVEKLSGIAPKRPGRIPFEPGPFPFCEFEMLREMRAKLGAEIEQLSHELNVLIPQAIAQAVELGDLRENSEYKAALERQQFVQARLGQLHQRLAQVSQLTTTEGPADVVGLGSKVKVLDLDTEEQERFMVVLAEMMDIEDGHISLASPLGRALKGRRVGDEIELRLPRGQRRLRVLEIGPG